MFAFSISDKSPVATVFSLVRTRYSLFEKTAAKVTVMQTVVDFFQSLF